MKKILMIVMLLTTLSVGAQTKTTQSPITFFGIPLGIKADDFKARMETVNSNITTLVHAQHASIFINMYEGREEDEIVWQAFLRAYNDYTSPGPTASRINSILCAKYGAPIESINDSGLKTLRWNFKGGFAQTWKEQIYGDNAETFYLQIVDYNALKLAEPELYKLL